MKKLNGLGKLVAGSLFGASSLIGLNNSSARAEETAKTETKEGFRREFDCRFQYWDLGKEEIKFDHRTHPDDYFLIGEPGSTKVGRAYALSLGQNLVYRKGDFEPYIGGSLLLIYGRDEHKNDNDPRPTGHEAQVYSKVFPLGGQVNAGLRYYPFGGKFSIGADVSGSLLHFSSGWDRFGADEVEKGEFKFLLNAGGSLRYKIDENSIFELGLQKGINNDTTMITAGFRFNL